MNINANVLSFTDYSQLQDNSSTQSQISQENEYNFQSFLNNKLGSRNFKNMHNENVDVKETIDADSIQYTNIENLNFTKKEETDLLSLAEALVERLNKNENDSVYSEVLGRLLKLIKKMTNANDTDCKAVMIALADFLASEESMKNNLEFISEKKDGINDTNTERVVDIENIYGSSNVNDISDIEYFGNEENNLTNRTVDGLNETQTESLTTSSITQEDYLQESYSSNIPDNNHIELRESEVNSGKNAIITTEKDSTDEIFGNKHAVNTYQIKENQVGEKLYNIQLSTTESMEQEIIVHEQLTQESTSQKIIVQEQLTQESMSQKTIVQEQLKQEATPWKVNEHEQTAQKPSRKTKNVVTSQHNRNNSLENSTYFKYNPQQMNANDFQNNQIRNEVEILNAQNMQYLNLNNIYNGLEQNVIETKHNIEKSNYDGETEAIKELFSGLHIQLEIGKSVPSTEQLDNAAQELFDKLLLVAQEKLGLKTDEGTTFAELNNANNDTEFLGLDYIKNLKFTTFKDSANLSNIKTVPDEFSQLLAALKSESSVESTTELKQDFNSTKKTNNNVLDFETVINIPNSVKIQNTSIGYEQVLNEQSVSVEKQISEIILAKINTLESGSTKLEVTLTPESLGKVTIKLVTESGRVSIEVIAEKPETQMLLQSRAEQLGQNLKQNGVELEKYVVYQEQGQEAYYNQDGGRRQRQQQEEEQSKSYRETEEESSLSFSELIAAV